MCTEDTPWMGNEWMKLTSLFKFLYISTSLICKIPVFCGNPSGPFHSLPPACWRLFPHPWSTRSVSQLARLEPGNRKATVPSVSPHRPRWPLWWNVALFPAWSVQAAEATFPPFGAKWNVTAQAWLGERGNLLGSRAMQRVRTWLDSV